MKIVVVGLGNIGSHLVGHLARMPVVSALVLVDPDRYDEDNVRSQDIGRGAVGRMKVHAQAARMRRIRADIAVNAHAVRVEEVPLGLLRADAILACVDTREARRRINRAAWRLGVPWIDSGVAADGLLARAVVYVPGPDKPCLECAWSDDDYALLEARYACGAARGAHASAPASAPTSAPASLGGLAASLQALECGKLLAGGAIGPDHAVEPGKTVLIDAAHHTLLTTRLNHNPNCRFDHRTWDVQIVPASDLPRERIALPRGRITVEERPFATRLSCPDCGTRRAVLRLRDRLTGARRTCRTCGGSMAATGFDLADSIETARRAGAGRTTARTLGLRQGDIFALEDNGTRRHYELA